MLRARGALALVVSAASAAVTSAAEACLSNPALADSIGGPPKAGSCCQESVCGLPCPEDVPPPTNGYLIAVILAIVAFCGVGFGSAFFIKEKAENFFVAGRTLPLFVVALTLAAQSIDSNALLGNADLSYKYHYWDGAVLPIGLGLSLFLNGVFLARHVHRANVLTLPDIYGRAYGPAVEVLVSIICCISFIALLAGNLVGMSVILGYLGDLPLEASVFVSGVILFLYTISGGLFSVAYSDVLQSSIGISGCLVLAFYFIANAENAAPPPSIGFPGYKYPDLKGDGGACDMYSGVQCFWDKAACCYNEAKWCKGGSCRADNGAYPFGDLPIFYSEMSDPSALAPFPNAIFCARARPTRPTRPTRRAS